MTDRTATVEIARSGKDVVFRLLRSSVTYDGMYDYQAFTVDPSTLPRLSSKENVASYGDTLRAALCSHPAVGSELEQMFGTAAPHRVNLHFAIGTSYAEPFRWEALCNAQSSFLAVSGLASLRRIAFAGAAPGTELRMYSSPLRMAAFLSPSGVSSAVEFEAITGALGDARAKGLDIEATVYLGEQDLLDQARARIAAGELAGIRVAPMPHDAIAIETVLANEPAQILHFFSHGYASAGVQLLEFASVNDHDIEASAGSIYFSTDRMSQVLASAGTAWLTVLSSCSSAHEMPGVFSMAATLAKSGSPVTIGMAEPIQSDVASLFANGFYGAAFEIIRVAVEDLPVGGSATIDFGPAADAARGALHREAEGDAFGRWCLPVLYQRDAPLRVGRAPDNDMPTRIALVSQSLRSLASTTPVELRDHVLALLDKDPAVPAQLRPDRFGNFA
jgi:hypothetical protein